MTGVSRPGDGVTTAPVARLGAYAIDCPDAVALGRFYASLLGGVLDESEPSWVELATPGGVLAFQRVQAYEPPAWPDGPAQQAHLDLVVDAYGPAHVLAVGLGATPLDPTGPVGTEGERGFRVYADPAGHPFCLCLS